MRSANIHRFTTETRVNIRLVIEGSGKADIRTGVGFLDHMLTLFAAHGRFDLSVSCEGDTQVDFHHSVEDIGIALGRAFADAAGDQAGIVRYADIVLPMDEALIQCAVDVSGRAYLGYGLDIPTQKVGDFDTELVKEFFLGFVRSFPAALHLRQLAGENSHHIIEGAFKAAGRVLSSALKIDPESNGAIPSTKGVL